MSWDHATLYRNGLYGTDGPIVSVAISIQQATSPALAAVWQDEAKTVPLPNPLPFDVPPDGFGLDVAGNIKACLDPGDYRLVWTDGSGDHGYDISVPVNQVDVGGGTAGTGAPGPAPWTIPTVYSAGTVYYGQTATAPATAVFWQGSTYVPIVPSVTGVTPDSDPSKWTLVAEGSDVQTAINQALAAYGGALAPHNQILGLSASTCDPATTSGSTFLTLAAGQTTWAAMLVQTPSASAINVLVSTAQIGSGAQVGIHAEDGTVLTSMSGTAVDTWLGTAGDRTLTLTSPLDDTDLTVGQLIYVSISQPASGVTTAPQLRQTPGSAAAANANGAAGTRAGTAAAATTPSPLPFGSATVTALPYVGLLP